MLQARLAAPSHRNARWGKLQPFGDDGHKRGIGATLFRNGTHARLQHRLPAMLLDTDDFIAGGFWRQLHLEDHAIARAAQRERGGFTRSDAIR